MSKCKRKDGWAGLPKSLLGAAGAGQGRMCEELWFGLPGLVCPRVEEAEGRPGSLQLLIALQPLMALQLLMVSLQLLMTVLQQDGVLPMDPPAHGGISTQFPLSIPSRSALYHESQEGNQTLFV